MDLAAKMALNYIGILILAIGGFIAISLAEADISLTFKLLGSLLAVPFPTMAAGLVWYSMRES